jgi:hypothetical protein
MLSKLERLQMKAADASADYRGWARIEGRLTDGERAAKEAAYQRYCSYSRAVDRQRREVAARSMETGE